MIKYNKGFIVILSIAVVLSLALLGMLIYGINENEAVISGAPSCALQSPAHLIARTPIKHVVIIFLENHSTDNLFGDYPANASLGVYMQSFAVNSSIRAPINLKPVPVGVYSTEDPNEGYIPYHADWSGGEMNGWEYGSGPQSLYYYTSAQVAPLWDLAEEYGLGVNYFSPYLSESAPNHLFLYAAYSPVIDDYGPPPYVPVQESIFAELCRYGVGWGYYVDPREPADYLDTKYFYGINKYSSHIQSWGDFIEEVRNGSLPAVAWLIPSASDSMGPPSSVLYGEAWLIYVINAVEESPIWNSTAIFITWDEFGGYYDGEPPPIVNGEPLGMRVPLLVVSPYAKEDYVSYTMLTHASLIAFIDYNWKLPALNKYVLNSRLPLDFFYFRIARKPLILNYFLGFPFIASIYSEPNSSEYRDLSQLFPMPLQLPPSELPYSNRGSTNETLASLGASVYVERDQPYTPLYLSPLFLWLLALLSIDLFSASLTLPRNAFGSINMRVLALAFGSMLSASLAGLVTITTGFLDYLGNTGEAPPLLLGYLIGFISFTALGAVAGRSWKGVISAIASSIAVPLLLYALIFAQAIHSYLTSTDPLLVYGFLSTAPAALVASLSNYAGGWRGLLPSIAMGVSSFVVVLFIAFEYIRSYQPGLATLLLPAEVIVLALAAAWFALIMRSGGPR